MAEVAITMEPSTLEHCRLLAPELREADLLEVLAGGAPDGLTALERSLTASEFATTVLFDGRPAAMLGAGPALRASLMGASVVSVWLLTGRIVDANPLAFWRLCKPGVAALLEHADELVAMVDARHAKCLRWACALGFTLGPEVPHGPSGMPFHCVSLRRF